MSKTTSKQTKQTKQTTEEVSSVAAPVVVAPASSKKSSKKVTAPMDTPAQTVTVESSSEVKAKVTRVKKEKMVEAASSQASSPVQTGEDSVEVVGDVVEEPPSTELFVEAQAKLHQLTTLVASFKSDFRQLERKYQKELKLAQKSSKKGKRKATNRAPSGFVKPTRISDELAVFLGKEIGCEMARTSVTREINSYIKANKLQDPTNGRKINPDAKLSALLKTGPEDELTYFNLQRFLSKNFTKTVKQEDVVSSSV